MNITEIKNNSKIKLTGSYIKCASSSLLYFIIISLLTLLQTKLTNLIEKSLILAIVQAIFILINWVLGYGIISNILDLINGKTNSITDFINSTLKNFIKYTKIGLLFLLKILFPLILNILIAFYWIGTKIANINNINFLCFNKNLLPLVNTIWIFAILLLIYYILKYVLIAYIFYDNPEMTENEIINKSNELMKKNKFKFILLLLSFLHWFLLAALIILILNLFIEVRYLTPFMVFFYSAIRPYIIVAKSDFYQELDS